MNLKSLVFLLVFSTILFLLRSSYAATVISVNESSFLDFGVISVGDGGGSVTSFGTSTGEVKSFSGASNGYFTIVGEKSKGNDSRLIRVFLTNLPGSLKSNSGGGALNSSLSLSRTSNQSSLVLNLPSGNGPKSISVPVYGKINFPAGSKLPGNYSASYDLVACSCDASGCPLSAADSLCY